MSTQITKSFKVEVKEHNLVKMYEKVVKEILTNKNIKVNYRDDDSMFDFLYGLHEDGYKNYSFKEVTQLLMYNSMLQAQASTPDRLDFILIRDEYTEIPNPKS